MCCTVLLELHAQPFEVSAPTASIQSMYGYVMLARDGKSFPAKAGMRIFKNDLLITPVGSFANINMGKGNDMLVTEQSKILFHSPHPESTSKVILPPEGIHVLQGTLRCRFHNLNGQIFKVQTPVAEADVLGTDFVTDYSPEKPYDNAFSLTVLSGKVGLHTRKNKDDRLVVQTNERINISQSGEPRPVELVPEQLIARLDRDLPIENPLSPRQDSDMMMMGDMGGGGMGEDRQVNNEKAFGSVLAISGTVLVYRGLLEFEAREEDMVEEEDEVETEKATNMQVGTRSSLMSIDEESVLVFEQRPTDTRPMKVNLETGRVRVLVLDSSKNSNVFLQHPKGNIEIQGDTVVSGRNDKLDVQVLSGKSILTPGTESRKQHEPIILQAREVVLVGAAIPARKPPLSIQEIERVQRSLPLPGDENRKYSDFQTNEDDSAEPIDGGLEGNWDLGEDEGLDDIADFDPDEIRDSIADDLGQDLIDNAFEDDNSDIADLDDTIDPGEVTDNIQDDLDEVIDDTQQDDLQDDTDSTIDEQSGYILDVDFGFEVE